MSTPQEIKIIFDKYFNKETTFPTNQIDAVVSFFMKRGFDDQSSKSFTSIMLNKAKSEGVDVFQLVDKLKGLTDAQLTKIIIDVINSTRNKTSILGFKNKNFAETIESRNIRV